MGKVGRFGIFGGQYVPETVMNAVHELEEAYAKYGNDPEFLEEYRTLLRDYAGRPSMLYYADRMTKDLGGCKIYLKREDLNHTGAHKINNVLGQILLAKKMGKKRIIAETGAGQHGVATATACAMFDMECEIYMGKEDVRRQRLNVYRMELLGAKVNSVDNGTATLKDAINEAMRDWATNIDTTFYLIGSVMGPHPYPTMVRDFQKVIGEEAKKQLMEKERESERTKNELITNVAHDLRTPLTSIIGYLELLAGNQQVPADMQHKYIEIAYGKSRRLQKLIEDLFGFTKLNYGKIAMHVGQIDIVKLLGQLVEEAYPNFVEKGLSYDLQSNVPAKIINADGNLLARLFDNLIGNAIKYGADGKRVLVKIHAESETVTVSVTNYGYVIPADELPLIFNKFYRVEQSRSSSTGGTGLGLAIAKEIVDMHGGTISVASDLNGTVFTVKLQVHFDVDKENFGYKNED